MKSRRTVEASSSIGARAVGGISGGENESHRQTLKRVREHLADALRSRRSATSCRYCHEVNTRFVLRAAFLDFLRRPALD
jgi:hypothetical protein